MTPEEILAAAQAKVEAVKALEDRLAHALQVQSILDKLNGANIVSFSMAKDPKGVAISFQIEKEPVLPAFSGEIETHSYTLAAPLFYSQAVQGLMQLAIAKNDEDLAQIQAML